MRALRVTSVRVSSSTLLLGKLIILTDPLLRQPTFGPNLLLSIVCLAIQTHSPLRPCIVGSKSGPNSGTSLYVHVFHILT